MDTPTLAASLTCLAVTLGYLAVCAAWPFKRCWRCRGLGRIYSPLGRRIFRLCPRCQATGRRIRLGRHLWNEWRRLHHDGTRPAPTDRDRTPR